MKKFYNLGAGFCALRSNIYPKNDLTAQTGSDLCNVCSKLDYGEVETLDFFL